MEKGPPVNGATVTVIGDDSLEVEDEGCGGGVGKTVVLLVLPGGGLEDEEDDEDDEDASAVVDVVEETAGVLLGRPLSVMVAARERTLGTRVT